VADVLAAAHAAIADVGATPREKLLAQAVLENELARELNVDKVKINWTWDPARLCQHLSTDRLEQLTRAATIELGRRTENRS